MKIYETELTGHVLEALIAMSVDWEAEKSCYGYRANGKDDIAGNRIFLAEENITLRATASAPETDTVKSAETELPNNAVEYRVGTP